MARCSGPERGVCSRVPAARAGPERRGEGDRDPAGGQQRVGEESPPGTRTREEINEEGRESSPAAFQ